MDRGNLHGVRVSGQPLLGQSPSRANMRGQSSIMEYLLLTVFILLVIIALIFFLTLWQISSMNMEEQGIKTQRLDTLLSRFTNSPLFVEENSVFDDSKLLAVQSLREDACDALEVLFGNGWFMEVEILTPRPGCSGPCTEASYSCCGYWEICTQPGRINTTRVLPVNVYRKSEGLTDLALLTVGVYS